MTLILNGTNGLSDVDGDASTPAVRGTDANTGIFFGSDIIGFSEGGAECARFNADAQFVAAAGTASLPVITTTGDVNTGIFFPAADTIAFAEGGAEAMRIDSSGNLLVGSTTTAGTSAPTAITVAGRLRSHNGQTASVANGATVDIVLNMPRALVSYIIIGTGNSNDQSAGFFRSNDNGASSAFTLFGQNENNVAVTVPSASTIRITNNTGVTVAFNFSFTIISAV